MLKTNLNTKKEQVFLQNVLKKNFEQIKVENPTYSLRSFARKLGISPTAMSEMINGKRLITSKTVLKILSELDLTSAEREKVQRFEKSKTAFEFVEPKYIAIDSKKFPFMSQWQYFAVLSLSELVDFKTDVAWIAERLNISKELAKETLDNLLKMEIFEVDAQGKIKANNISFKVSSANETEQFKNGHTENIELARKALDRFTRDELDFTSVTIAVDTELLPAARELLKDFRRKLSLFLEAGKKEEVYKLNIQLFPLTKSK